MALSVLHDAIVNSCNVFFYNVGKDLGIDRISHYATMMGLGRKTGIDLPNEDAGLIPSVEWKQRVYKTAWYPGETISVAIGQGYVSVTPMQAAWAMGGLAIGRPSEAAAPGESRSACRSWVFRSARVFERGISDSRIDRGHRDAERCGASSMRGGTGTSRAKVEGFDVAGKTGTAQVVGKTVRT